MHANGVWSQRRGSNSESVDYKSTALPLGHTGIKFFCQPQIPASRPTLISHFLCAPRVPLSDRHPTIMYGMTETCQLAARQPDVRRSVGTCLSPHCAPEKRPVLCRVPCMPPSSSRVFTTPALWRWSVMRITIPHRRLGRTACFLYTNDT